MKYSDITIISKICYSEFDDSLPIILSARIRTLCHNIAFGKQEQHTDRGGDWFHVETRHHDCTLHDKTLERIGN